MENNIMNTTKIIYPKIINEGVMEHIIPESRLLNDDYYAVTYFTIVRKRQRTFFHIHDAGKAFLHDCIKKNSKEVVIFPNEISIEINPANSTENYQMYYVEKQSVVLKELQDTLSELTHISIPFYMRRITRTSLYNIMPVFSKQLSFDIMNRTSSTIN